jgi:hypothetical protein
MTTVPLQSRMNASSFWIMLLLSSSADERRMIDGARYSVGGPQSVGVALSRRKQGFESPRERHLHVLVL